jgi:hypothetical protein
MYIKLTVAMLAMLQSMILMADELPRPTPYQSDATITNKISTGEKSQMSDREKAGLRGPVQQCTEERTTPAFENFPATSYVSINKYSPEGRIIEAATGNSIDRHQNFLPPTPTIPQAACSKRPRQLLVRPRPNQNITTIRKAELSVSPGTR